MFEESVVVKNTNDSQETYIVNQNNYTGGEKINAWKTFIEVFEKEIEKPVDNNPIDESNTISSCNCEIEYSDVDVDVDILDKSSLNDKNQNFDSFTDSDSDSDSDSEIDMVEKSTNNKNPNYDSYTDSDTSFNSDSDSDSDSEIDMVDKLTNNKNQKYDSDYSDYLDSYTDCNLVKSNKDNDLLDLDSDSDINIKSDGKS